MRQFLISSFPVIVNYWAGTWRKPSVPLRDPYSLSLRSLHCRVWGLASAPSAQLSFTSTEVWELYSALFPEDAPTLHLRRPQGCVQGRILRLKLKCVSRLTVAHWDWAVCAAARPKSDVTPDQTLHIFFPRELRCGDDEEIWAGGCTTCQCNINQQAPTTVTWSSAAIPALKCRCNCGCQRWELPLLLSAMAWNWSSWV